jgi:SAM-dependent methyltransferase
VLDVACGAGAVACAAARTARQVTGIDMTPAMIERAEAVQAAAGQANLAWHVGDVTRLPFRACQFDVVLMRYSLHHFPRPAEVVAEMARVCKPSGRVAVADLVLPPDKAAAYDGLERLRDPSHVRVLAEGHGLRPPVVHRVSPDYGPYDGLTEDLGWSLITVYITTTPTTEHAEFIRDRLKEKTDKWGPGAASLSPDVINLSHLYGLLGRHADAIALLESYTAAVPEPKRAEHINYWLVVKNLSESYAALGRRREAVAVLTDHIERLRLIGLGETGRQSDVLALARQLGERDEWPAAVRACEDVLAERRKLNPPDWRVFSARAELGRALTGAKRYAEAVPELLAAYRGLTDPAYPLPDHGSSWPSETADSFIRLYIRWGKPDEVAKWRAERAKYPCEEAPPPRGKN